MGSKGGTEPASWRLSMYSTAILASASRFSASLALLKTSEGKAYTAGRAARARVEYLIVEQEDERVGEQGEDGEEREEEEEDID